jgi:hypothetical protein
MTAPPRPIVVVIDELVLHGFEQRHGPGIATALRTELATSLVGWQPGGHTSIDHLDAGSFTHPGADAPDAVGRAVARHIRHALPNRPAPGSRGGRC